jgi:hypothetical protein
LKAFYRVSERQVCEVLEIGRTTYRYEGRKEHFAASASVGISIEESSLEKHSAL